MEKGMGVSQWEEIPVEVQEITASTIQQNSGRIVVNKVLGESESIRVISEGPRSRYLSYVGEEPPKDPCVPRLPHYPGEHYFDIP